MDIGNYTLHSIHMGSFALDGGAMFGVVPKVLWQKENPADEMNRIDMHTRCLLLQDKKNKKNILIDCGLGDKGPENFNTRFKISSYQLEAELKKYHLTSSDITDVLATHLHFDHIGGLTKIENGKILPRFPNADLWVQKRNWQHAYQPNEKDRASYLKENFSIYEGSPHLHLVDGEQEVFPGIRVMLSEGHTIGMQLPIISDDKYSLIYCADIIPMSAHVKVAWIMGYDCFPLIVMEEKKKILKAAAEKGTIIFFEHCPYMDGAKVEWNGKDFQVKEKIYL